MDSYDMYGASPWERVPDILEMYGMCSYRNWYEYLELVDPNNKTASRAGNCDALSNTIGCDPESFDVDKSLWTETARAHNEPSMRSIWSTNKFRVHAHPCDMDYMHIDGMRGCSPVTKNDNSAMGVFDRLTRSQDFKSARQDVRRVCACLFHARLGLDSGCACHAPVLTDEQPGGGGTGTSKPSSALVASRTPGGLST